MPSPDYTFMDGFDKYGTLTGGAFLTTLSNNVGEWNSFSGSVNLLPAFVGTGMAVQISGIGSGHSNFATRTLPANYVRFIGGIYCKGPWIGGSNSAPIKLRDGTTDTLSVSINTDGSISLRRGGEGGTVIQTYSTVLLSNNEAVHIGLDAVVNNTTGSAKVYRNGVEIINVSGVDTANTANNYYNQIAIGSLNTGQLDHFFSWNYLAAGGGDAFPTTNPTIETDWGDSDDSIDTTTSITYIGDRDYNSSYGGFQGTNEINLRRVYADTSGDLTGVAWMTNTTSVTPQWKVCCYADSAGEPGALLAQSASVTGVTSGLMSANFTAPLAITAGTYYWIGTHANAAIQQLRYDGALSNTARTRTVTYATGLPNPFGSTTTDTEVVMIGLVTSGVSPKVAAVNNTIPFSSAYNEMVAVNDEDLYGFPTLPSTPSAIYSVAVKAWALRTDVAPRTIDLLSKSGTTTGSGSAPGQTPSTAGGWVSSYFNTDPNTGLPWTGNLSGVKHGIKIAS